MKLTEGEILKSPSLNKLGHIRSCSSLDQGLESRNFLLVTNSGKYILKSYKNTPINEIIFETSLLNHLKHFNGKFPSPVSEVFYINSLPCVLYTFIEGRCLIPRDINISTLQKIARLQASLHKNLVRFIPSGNKKRFSIFDLSFVDTFRCNCSMEDTLLIKNCRDWLGTRLERERKSTLPKSIIHEDLEMENILVDREGDIKFIDFGESHKAEVISDIATAIKELIINNYGTDAYNLIRAYLNAYEKINPVINVEQLEMLYTLFMRRGLFMFTYLLSKQVKNKDLSLNKKIKTERTALKSLLLDNDLEQNIVSKILSV